jgi:hypothetical protein
MQFSNTWAHFINNHPDKDELCNLSHELVSMINPTDPINTNVSKIIELNPIVVVTLDPFSKQLSPMFFHHRLGLPIQTQNSRLVALTGFGNPATPMEIDQKALFSATDTAIETPSLSEFMSFHNKDSNQLSTIEPTTDNLVNIKLAAILPPKVFTLFHSSHTSNPWTLLLQAITIVHSLKPELATIDENGDDDLTFAEPFYPLLCTLWAFTQSTEATKNIHHPQRAVCTDPKSLEWHHRIHNTHLRTSNLPPTNAQPHQPSESIAEGINRLAKSLEDKNNDRFALNDEDQDDKESKGWKKLDATFKKIILFASSTDGENPAPSPTERLQALINTKSGAIVSRLINSWHKIDIVVQTGMASNIQKGCIISSNGPFSVNTFSPFFTPAVRAGFNIMSHDELNSIEFASQSNNLSNSDIQKMVHSKPYIPTEPYLFIAQIKNFHAVLSDCLGSHSLIAISIEDVINHFIKNELLYYNTFAQEPNFAVWFLNQMHFKVQQLIHQCAAAETVQDVQFHMFTMEDELKNIGTNNVIARAPAWYIQMKQEEEMKKRHDTKRNGQVGNNPSNPSNNNDIKHQEKRRTINNNNLDKITKLKDSETYSFVAHYQNLKKCEGEKVMLDGEAICNNWHMRGWCTDGCRRKGSHKKLTGETLEKYRAYVNSLRAATAEFATNLKRNKTRGRPLAINNNDNTNTPFEKEEKSSTGKTID